MMMEDPKIYAQKLHSMGLDVDTARIRMQEMVDAGVYIMPENWRKDVLKELEEIG